MEESVAMDMMNEMKNAVDKSMTGIQRHIFFDLQKSFYECGYNCFNNPKASEDQIQHCLNKCQAPLQKAQLVVDHELTRFQERLQRSLMVCQDKVQVFGELQEGEPSQVQHMEKCMESSIKDQMKMLPALANHIQKQISGSATR